MEGALQSVKAFLTALASQLSSLIKDQIDSITVEINHVRTSMNEALLSWERISQKFEDKLSKITADVQLGRETNVENMSESVEESEIDDLNSAMGSSSKCMNMNFQIPSSKTYLNKRRAYD
ncbi:unnamed protein product [Eruca vesicaria subsp. sativa]|uniref:Uncharacterized protein n=1 Tax=Eruca vesicaria subsp. sativa TaxID=29727 RepID=A0ABC8JYF5_ERUVS|nr:unnamed protein product [Eruca vesicaria subsp. sativa]